MEDTLTLVFVCTVILAGFFLNQIWISLIFAIALFALLFSGAGEKTRASSPGVQVRPIIVKRKYVGPESIYPKEMKIQITPEEFKTGTPVSIEAPSKFGTGIGKLIKKLFSD